MSRIESSANMHSEDIDQLRRVAHFFNGPLLIHKLATTLALNHQAEEAGLWLLRLCKSSPVPDCAEAQKYWAAQSQKYPEIAAILWSNH